MKLKCLLIIVFQFALVPFCFSQGLNNLWYVGYGDTSTAPWGNGKIDFFTGSATVTNFPIEMEFDQAHANISDSAGNMLFYTNGYYIANANNDTMVNGTGINPSVYTSINPDGLNLNQPNLIIPMPGDNHKYYFIHCTRDNINISVTKFIYASIIDISLNGNLGEVISKNQIILSDDLNKAKLSAVKHGNGRDWWVLCHKMNTNLFYKFLITPSGINNPATQAIGINRPEDTGQTWFSPDGSKFAYYWFQHGLEIFDFDRCTGLFSNPVHINVDPLAGSGVAFSPNGNVLYASATDELYQFDLTAANIAASKTVVAVWDSFLYTLGSVSLPTWFELMALAPDGKIYITTGNGTQQMHIIDQPDILGTACNVMQHALQIPTLYANTLPNHPNYHLGPLVGSVCDTVYTGIPPPEERLTLKLYPNPNNGTFQITYTPVPENLKLQVFNILGKEVHAQLLPQWSQLQYINVGKLPAGVYMATITSSASKKSVKFIVEE
ncbi:MAG: T9SS type A sorting domain-containing protein [Bacteroidia bacterium]|nr:T9SS type A sorting domain-containing protein [Bacteroidia bacterium]